MYKIIFIAHGGRNIGMGHIIRSMSLAHEFRLHNYEVTFISRYETGQKVLLENGFHLIPINGKEINVDEFYYGSKYELEQDLRVIPEILLSEMPDIVAVDSYNVTTEFFFEIAPFTKCLIYIDDIASFSYPVDIIINGNISAALLKYEKLSENQQLLLGLKYNLIRQEFSNIPRRKVSKKCKSIMISTGASDPHNMTYKILNMLLNSDRISSYSINIVIGKGFKDHAVKQIKELALLNPFVSLYENPPKMSKIMLQSDLAITAGGSTIYELFACGVITFAFIYADNQKNLVETAEQKGYLFNMGYYNRLDEKVMIENITMVSENYSLKKNIVEKIQSVIDCKGTHRIVKVVDAFMLKIN